jgi:hypothetical protein
MGQTKKNYFYNRTYYDLRQNRRKSKTNIKKLYNQSFPAKNGVICNRI